MSSSLRPRPRLPVAVLGVTALSAAGLTLAAACSPINTTSTWGNTGGSTSVTGGSTTSGSGQGGDPDPFPTGGFGGSGVGGAISACDATADEDKDKDGFSKAQGDCNDCDPSVNPGAIEVVATPDADGGVPEPADEDCDGMIDNVAPPCDDGLALADVDANHAAQALEICKVAAPADPKSWGLLGAKYVRANGTPMSPSLQTGIEEAFGPNVAPRAGKRMMALSSGHARTPNQPGACGTQTCTENVGVAPPNGFPQDVPNCPGLSNINDDVALELSLRAPSNANGYAFDFFFVSFEYPEWVCTSYNDQFIALVSPPPAQSQNGNISFDSMSNPVSVNIAFFDVCQGCPLGAAQLAGTGFDLWGDAGGTGWLTTQTPVKGGDTFSIRFAIWDTGDQALDSTTLIDDFRWLATSGTVETVTLPTGPPGSARLRRVWAIDPHRLQPKMTGMALPPGPRTPALVQTIMWLREPVRGLDELGRLHGEVFSAKSLLFGQEVLFTHPRAIKQILTGDAGTFNASEGNSVLGAVLGKSSVMLLDGAAHARQRKLMMPAFHGERLQRYAAGIRASAIAAIAAWRPASRFKLQEAMQELTLDVILRVVLGLADEGEKAPVREAILRVLHRVQSPTGALWMLPAFQRDLGPLTPWAAIKRTIDEMDQTIFAHLARRREAKEERDDVLSMLLAAVDEEGQGMSDGEIRDELVTLLLAGHETTALAIAWAFEELLRAPGEQARLRAEVAGLGEGGALSAEKVPRLDSVIKEALRLHPITGGVARKLKKQVTIEGWDLPAGVVLVPCFHLLHRRPDLYPDPDRFVADRFIGKKVDPYEWMPFGAGAHRCIGMAFAMLEMRVVMAEILARVELRLEASGPAESTLRSLLVAPKGGTRVIVERAPEPRRGQAHAQPTAA